MLYILTGDIQIGKTRWLQKTVSILEDMGVGVQGVIAPGIWKKTDSGFEKLGICNLLLPSHEEILFARRRDLTCEQDLNSGCSQARQANLGWAIQDKAIRVVNDHFKLLGPTPYNKDEDGLRCKKENCDSPILIIDELGVLELIREEGLTEAVDLLSQGSQGYYQHALIIVGNRRGLPLLAKQRFGESWGGCTFIHPEDISPKEWVAKNISVTK